MASKYTKAVIKEIKASLAAIDIKIQEYTNQHSEFSGQCEKYYILDEKLQNALKALK